MSDPSPSPASQPPSPLEPTSPGPTGALPPELLQEPAVSMCEDRSEFFHPTWPCNQVLEGDCLERMREIPDESIHLVLCDLPYGTTQNKWDSVIPLAPLWEEYRRILAPKGAVVLTSQGPFTARLILSNEAWFKYKLVWVKSKSTNFLNAKKQPLRRHEDVCVFYPSQPKYTPQMQEGDGYDKGVRKDQLTGSYGDFRAVQVKSQGGRYPTDVLYFKTAESEGEVWHPTQKPVALGRYFVRTFTQPGQVVLDNTSGAGSFLVAALREGRNFLGVEINDAPQRFKNADIHLIDVTRRRLTETWSALPESTRETVARCGWIGDLDTAGPEAGD